MNKLIIGIVPTCQLNINDNPFDDKYTFINNYSKCIMNNNAIPIGLIMADGNLDLHVLDICDGFLFPGGKKLEKIHFEILLYALSNNKPVLGICLGMQVMAYFGILEKELKERNLNVTVDNMFKVYLENKDILEITDIKNNNHGNDIMKELVKCNKENLDKSKHDINILKNSILYKVYKQEKLNVYSLHTKTIKKYGDIFKISATATDGIIEALEYYDENYFIVGIQYHPELNNDQIFNYFINEVARRKINV